MPSHVSKTLRLRFVPLLTNALVHFAIHLFRIAVPTTPSFFRRQFHDAGYGIDAYVAVLGLLLRQEGIGYHRPICNGSKYKENGVNLNIGRVFTPKEARARPIAACTKTRKSPFI